MPPVNRWVIFYADGSTFTSDDGTWAEAPVFGVYCVVYYDVNGYQLRQREGEDVSLYRWLGPQPTAVVELEGTPVGMDTTVKMGLWTDNESWWRLHDATTWRSTP